MFKRDAASRVILSQPAPGGEVELGGLFHLCQVAIEARSAGEQFEDASLVEDVDLVLPNHIVDGREFVAVADECGREAGEFVVHSASFGGWASCLASES